MTTVKAKIFRFNPETDDHPRYEVYDVEHSPSMKVLDLLKEVYRTYAPDLGFMYGCRSRECGTCSVRMNKRAVLACQEKVEGNVLIEPLLSPFCKLVRDLIVDRSGIDHRLRSEEYFMSRAEPHRGMPDHIDPKIILEIQTLGKCIDCLICLDRCPAHHRRDFYGPMFMVQLLKLMKHPMDMNDRLYKSYDLGLWSCIQCQQCAESCPLDIDPAKAIRELRMAGLKTIMGIQALKQIPAR